MPIPVAYTIRPHAPEAHLFEVSCCVAAPNPAGQIFTLPAWIPGSYMIREFSRNIVHIRAEAQGYPVALEKLDKATWKAAPTQGPLTIICQVYAWDLSVRTAHLDTTHGFFNGTSVFLKPQGQEHYPCHLTIAPPAGANYTSWQLATSLKPLHKTRQGFGEYQAENYEDLIDHPVEMGTFTRLEFKVKGIPHSLVVTGQTEFNQARLCKDLETLCTWQMELFGAPDLDQPYVFLVMAVGSGYGGLEHKNSTALICNRNDLPSPGLAENTWTEGYVRFLGLCSHEYFHRWNVKRIRPQAFVNQTLAQESYTRLLWLFEGFTSYYDDLCLVRSGLIPEATYLDLLGKTITQVQKNPGWQVQSLEDSSFDTWIKYYRPDENTPNAVVSYYTKGALIALCLDLALRHRSKGASSLDTLMRQLWQEKGATGVGITETEIFNQVSTLGGKALGRWLKQAVCGTEALPLARHLGHFGIQLEWQPESQRPWLGCRFAAGSDEAPRITHVLNGSPAEAAGLAPGDTLIALNQQRLSSQNLDAHLENLKAGQAIDIHFFRHDLLAQTRLTLAPAPQTTAKLTAQPGASKKISRQSWLCST